MRWSAPALLLLVPAITQAEVVFTGDAELDFNAPGTVVVKDPYGVDVGMPPAYYQAGLTSGWDMKDIRLSFDPDEDVLYISLNTYGIGGDADGDGDPGSAGQLLSDAGGEDLPNLEGVESFTILFDLDEDDTFDIVAGVSNTQDISLYTVATFSGNPNVPGNSVGWGEVLVNHVGTVFGTPSAAEPDLEFTITNLTALSQAYGLSRLGTFKINAFMGSSADEGIGDDYIPRAGVGVQICLDPDDLDGDGYRLCDNDCDDEDAQINPSIPETCNGLDDDCNGASDDGFDADGDGLGDCLDTEECDEIDNDGDQEVDEGFDLNNNGTADCLEETCDGIDNDSDGISDEGFDSDGDGIGDCLESEICDGVDNDGNGEVDEGYDSDNNGIPDCQQPELCNELDDDHDGNVDEGDNDGDGVDNCDDTEVCDGLDNDGDLHTDEGFDSDTDGVANCDDREECDGLDNDGDTRTDEGFDADRDGVGDCFDSEECDSKDNDGDSRVDEGLDNDGDGVSDCFDQEECDAKDNDGDGNVDEGLEDSSDADCRDIDRDDIPEVTDNCDNVANPDQADIDGDGIGDVCDDLDEGNPFANVRVHGNGCDNTGGGGATGLALALLLLLGVVRSGRSHTSTRGRPGGYLPLWGLMILGGGASLSAEEAITTTQGIPVQQFQPAAGGDGNFNGVYGSDVLGHKYSAFGLYANYAWRPLTIDSIDGTDPSFDLIHDMLAADLHAALGLKGKYQLGVVLPMTLRQTGESADWISTTEIPAQAIGDIRLMAKWHLFGGMGPAGLPTTETGPAAALVGIVTLPTGNVETLQGSGSATFEPRGVIEMGITPRLRAAGNVGYLLRQQTTLFGLEVGNELTLGAGLAVSLIPKKFSLQAESWGRLPLDPDSEVVGEALPVEWNLSGRLWMAKGNALTLGAGRGLTQGYGTPAFRGFVGYGYTGRPGPADRDDDGLVDEVDKCPDAAEDLDDYQDEDGCPELDNDNDGLVDKEDDCPDEAEDVDTWQDEDGCPDEDNDSDGITDVKDACPLQPEDKDGFQDEDGCIDADNDTDGIVDEKDKCPDKAEDRDFFEDTDGCPEEGEAMVVLTNKEIKILQNVLFEFGKATILPISYPLLLQVVSVLESNPQISKLSVEGHADEVGSASVNRELSAARAQSVMQFLIDNGIKAERLTSAGYGSARPIADNADELGRAKNRRVEFIIIEVDGKTIEREPYAPPPGVAIPDQSR